MYQKSLSKNAFRSPETFSQKGFWRSEARIGLMYRLSLICGLGGHATQFTNQIHRCSKDAWTTNMGNPEEVINGGSPLEIAVRSDRWPEIRCSTCVGPPGTPPAERLLLGISSCKELLTELGGEEITKTIDWINLIKWAQSLNPSLGTFGCYLGVCYSKKSFRVKLYHDLFEARKSAEQKLAQWYQLLSALGQDFDDNEHLRLLLPLAMPVMGCIEWDSKGRCHWKLYWRIKQPTQNTMCAIGNIFSVSSAFCKDVYHSFFQAAGGASKQHPITGFVHPAPLMKGTLGFYSSAPSRWTYTNTKKRILHELWEKHSGDSAALTKVWLVARGPYPLQWVPTLNIIGIGIINNSLTKMAAYFKPHDRIKK